MTATPVGLGATTLRAGRELEWNRALVNHAHPDAARGPRGGGGAHPPAAAARRVYPPADGGALLAAAAGGPGPAESHRHHPRSDEPDPGAGDPDAGDAPGRGLAAQRPLGADGRGDVPAQGPEGR